MGDMSHRRYEPRFAFSEDDLVVIEGRPMRLCHRNSEGCSFQKEGGGLTEHFTHAEIATLQQQNRITVKGRHFVAQGVRHVLERADTLHCLVDGTIAERIRYREAMVLGFKEVQRKHPNGKGGSIVSRTDASIAAYGGLIRLEAGAFYAENGAKSKTRSIPTEFSPRSLRRWLKNYDAMGRVGLGDACAKSGNRAERFPREVAEILSEQVNRYLSLNRPTKKKIHENVQIAVHDLNDERSIQGLPALAVPSRNAVSAAIDRLDPFHVAVAREGKEAATRRLRQTGQGLSGDLIRPMQRVEMDDVKIDLFTLFKKNGFLDLFSEEERSRLGLNEKHRWHVTTAICATTRVILGMRLTYNPNTLSALECLQMCLNDKGRYADAVGALSPWSMSGLMELIVTDAGSSFKADDFRTACADLGIRQEITVAGCPQLRARIERLFGTLNHSLLPRLSGRTFHSSASRGDHDALGEAALSVDDLIRVLVRWVVDVYHNTPHEGLGGRTPLEAWEQAMLDWGVTPPPGPEIQAQIFARSMQRKLEGDGVTVLGVRYHSRELAEWCMHHRPSQVNVRWSPDDIGAIWVKAGTWIKVPAVFEGFAGLRADEWTSTARRLRVNLRGGQELARSVVRRAIKEIENVNALARVREGIITKNWQQDDLDRLERDVFVGFKVADAEEAPATTSPGDGIGRAVTPLTEPEAFREEDIPSIQMRRAHDDDWDIKD